MFFSASSEKRHINCLRIYKAFQGSASKFLLKAELYKPVSKPGRYQE
jgi:hypothetical protein